MATIVKNGGTFDWCHVCGNRSSENADVVYPENAEHETEYTTRRADYIRICAECAEAIGRIARSPVSIQRRRQARKFDPRRPKSGDGGGAAR